jgi:hypothetical protein
MFDWRLNALLSFLGRDKALWFNCFIARIAWVTAVWLAFVSVAIFLSQSPRLLAARSLLPVSSSNRVEIAQTDTDPEQARHQPRWYRTTSDEKEAGMNRLAIRMRLEPDFLPWVSQIGHYFMRNQLSICLGIGQ